MVRALIGLNHNLRDQLSSWVQPCMKKAGFELVRCVNIVCGVAQMSDFMSREDEETFLFCVDVGASGLRLILFSIEDGIIDSIDNREIPELGGDYMTQILANQVCADSSNKLLLE